MLIKHALIEGQLCLQGNQALSDGKVLRGPAFSAGPINNEVVEKRTACV